ncbi:Glycosyltransferase involved in cell wall bisynthesis [Tardiphaga sp. OK246]|uniref:glycosyltransferase family 4 protein n=1 Tax=Tardiphaga sp. OK246 TaxID=1855307 RepID=UPI000B6A8363|nr:glycosyltransferase family 4 protein [Tardiphaga sp. OK246]SNT63981.1 Glycosyltransferase involved in cell wall bisynthesis [Tardiphaga sp. OK246]
MLARYLSALRRYRRQLSAKEFLTFVVRKTGKKIMSVWSSRRLDVAISHDFVEPRPYYPSSLDGPLPNTINWVVPDFSIGSGGHINIFRLVGLCERAGYTCRIIIDGRTERTSVASTRKLICKHFSCVEAEVFLGMQNSPPAMITVATSWSTAYAVRDFQGTHLRAYFVQDYEPFFYPHGSDYLLAENTYNMNFFGITAGDWLANLLASQHGMETVSMGFSYDRNLYRQLPRMDSSVRRVFFYARPATPRRGFELGLLALQRVSKALPNVEFVLAGGETDSYDVRIPHRNVGNVPLAKLADVYSQCDVALVISATNLSLLPLELMACGCVVVSNRGGNTEWLLSGDNSILTDATPSALADGIIQVLVNDELRVSLAAKGKRFCESTSWDIEASKVIEAFNLLQQRSRLAGVQPQ